jgi:hypothetical protein
MSLDDLMEAQQRIIDTNPDPELQKKAMATMAKLGKLRGDSQTVTLGDVKTELKGLRTDLKAVTGKTPTEAAAPSTGKTSAPAGESSTDRTERLRKLGDVIESKTNIERGGARNEGVMDRNRSTFDRFVTESSKREDILKDASEKQVEIFAQLEATITKLREAGSDESRELQKEIARLSGELGQTDDTKARGKIGGLAENALNTSSIGARGNQGNLGDAFAALTGKKTVLKEGFGFDARGGSIRNEATGKYAGKKDAAMGRLGGAASILGGFIGDKANKFVEGRRNEGFQNFMNTNVRSTNFDADRLAGAQAALAQPASAPAPVQPATPARGKPQLTVIEGGRSARGAAPAAVAGATGSMKANVINITGKVVNLTGGAAAAPGDSNYSDSGGVSSSEQTKPAAATAAPAGAESSGFGLGDALDLMPGKGMLSRGGSLIKGGASKIGGMIKGGASMGKNLLGKIPGGALKGGIAGLAGLGLSYGGDKLKEAGYEKTGAAADIAGKAASWGGTGAMIGSVIPGLGTAVGAGVGAAAGGAYGLYKNWGSLFGDKKKGGEAAGNEKKGGDASAKVVSKTETKYPIIESYKEAITKGEVTPEQALDGIKQIAPDNAKLIEAAQKEFGSMKKGAAAPKTAASVETAPASSGARISQMSVANEQAKTAKGNAPVIVNNNTTNNSSSKGDTIMPRAGVRPDESAMERYASRSAHYF